MLLYIFNFIFVSFWITGIYSFVTLRDTPSIQAREWRLKLFTNFFALIYITYMCFTFEHFFGIPTEERDFGPYCPYFTLMHLLLSPFISGSLVLMYYNLQFITRRLTRNLSGFFESYYWTTRFDMTIMLFLVYCIVYDIPNLLLIVSRQPEESPTSPTECYGDQVLVNCAQSFLAVLMVHFLRRHQLKPSDPYWVGLEMDIHNYGGMILFPVFHVPFFMQYYYKHDFGSYTPFHSHLIYVTIYHISTIWIPFLQSRKREGENLQKIKQLAEGLVLDNILQDEFMCKRFKLYIESTKTKDSIMVDLYKELEVLYESDPDEEGSAEFFDREARRIYDGYLNENLYVLPTSTRREITIKIQEQTLLERETFLQAKEDLEDSLTKFLESWKKIPQFTTTLAQSDLTVEQRHSDGDFIGPLANQIV